MRSNNTSFIFNMYLNYVVFEFEFMIFFYQFTKIYIR